ncbi:MAG: branched-chain amino acid ABC transporter permease, partial [Alphaproteobacteria bacterium]|nr:branched-chain amino acid ABC transporter permease [Alphaproteobacteria bacterium]
MMEQYRTPLMFAIMAALLAIVGIFQSWNVALTIVNLCLISSIMTLGVNIQWGYAGLVNFGMMGFTALGGLAAVLIAMPPVPDAWAAGGSGVMAGLAIIIVTVIVSLLIWKKLKGSGAKRYWLTALSIVIGVVTMRLVADPSIAAIESVESARTGYLGGFGLPVTLSWIVGGFVAAGAAFVIGRISLGLRSDYLAIATLGISEIVIYVLKNEDWLARGVKNINGLPRPVPYEIELQETPWVSQLADMLGA